jgi:hypothetical protein
MACCVKEYAPEMTACEAITVAGLHELMDGRVAADEGAAANADVTAEHGVVRKGDAIANVAIMRDMGTSHKDATFADPCDPAAGFRADIHGNAFASPR